MGGGQNSPMQVIVPLWLERNGVDAESVEMLQLAPSIIRNALIELLGKLVWWRAM